jgi:small-conductance mechanosensitive channel
MLRVLAVLVLLALPALAQPAPGAPPGSVPAPGAGGGAAPAAAASPELGALLDILRDDERRAALVRALEAAGQAPGATAEEPAALPAPAEIVVGLAGRIAGWLGDALRAVHAATDLSGVGAWLRELWRDGALQAQVASLAWKLALVMGGGLVAERLARWVLRGPNAVLERRAAAVAGPMRLLRRLPYIGGHLLLDMLPVLLFGAVALSAIHALATWPSNRVMMETVALAYMAARAAMAAGRVVFAPSHTRLRLLRCEDETAAYATLWIRRLALTLVGFYAASELALLFGLPWAAHQAIWRLGLLVLSILGAILVLQNRAAVARLLAAPPLGEGDVPDGTRRFLRAARDRLAMGWHVVVILWLLAAWTIWALRLPGGFERLTRASVATLVLIVLGKLVDEGVRRGLARLFTVSPEMAKRYPGLEARANRYLPALRGALSFLVLLAVIVLLLEAWGLGALSWFGTGRWGGRAASAVMVVLVTAGLALLIWEGANAAIARHLAALPEGGQAVQSARVRTLLPMLRTALGIVLVLVVGLTVLAEVGINVAPLLAGAGVVGLAVGFGSQTLVRDVITGIFLLFEDAVAVGDTVTVGGLSGTVEQLSIRSIRLRALDGSVHIVPFSSVSTVTNQTRDFGYAVVDVALDYAEDTDQAVRMLRAVGEELRDDEAWAPQLLAPLEVMGVDRMTDQGVVVRARVMTPPARRWAVGRELNRRIKQHCDALDIRLFAAGQGRAGVHHQPSRESVATPPAIAAR